MRFTLYTLALALAACGGGSGDTIEGMPGSGPDVPEYSGAGGGSQAESSGGSSGAGAPATGEVNTAVDGTPVVGAGMGGASSASSAGAANDTGAGGAGASGGSASATPGAGGTAAVFPEGVTRPRIMIVGDSISAGPGCYKRFLLANLQQNGYASFEFVGEYTDDCGGGVRHSAVSCSTAQQYTLASFSMPNCAVGMSFPGMSALTATHRPDLVMLQLGVNDVWGGRAVDAILADYGQLVAQARAANPNVVLAVAQIAKIRPDCSADDSIERRAEMLVNAVPAWAASQSQPGSPVFVADLWTNSDWSQAETLDCVHPNDAGAQRMGLNWFNALKDILPRD